MELLLGYELLESYKRLPYKVWYALAEFIDNSTQSYRNKVNILQPLYDDAGDILTVTITYNNNKLDGFIKIEDNAFGMSEEVLRKALILGRRPEKRNERSKYGMGLKTAAFWFGDAWEITTTELGSLIRYRLSIDLKTILQEEQTFNDAQKDDDVITQFKPRIEVISEQCEESEHGTTIIITKLNQTLTPTKAANCKEYLGSIYRRDIEKGILRLVFQDEELSYMKAALMSRVLTDEEGKKFYKDFSLNVNGKEVKGWAAVLKNGGRNLGGFALIQADRVIQGWPSNYRPTELFGDQEGGTNTLTNQRLFGELELDGFEVSHTKDTIIFTDDDERLLNELLLAELGDYKKIATDFRLKDDNESEEFDFSGAINNILGFVKKNEFQDILFNKQVLPFEVIEDTNQETLERLLNIDHEEIRVEIANIIVKVILSNESSPYDPYLIVKFRSERNKVTIVLNKNHSYWKELSTKDAIYYFICSCIYDGLSEWKAYYVIGNIEPDTIKMIKDSFLRIPLNYR